MIKDRLRELNIKLTELSDYVKISRPTLYKYIEAYDSGDFRNVRPEVLNLFRYIEEPDTKKEQALAYMISVSNGESSDSKDIIRNYLTNPTATESKVEVMKLIVTTNYLDEVLPYISNCLDILSKNNITEDELHQVARLVLLKSKVTRNAQLSTDELNEAKTLLRGRYNE